MLSTTENRKNPCYDQPRIRIVIEGGIFDGSSHRRGKLWKMIQTSARSFPRLVASFLLAALDLSPPLRFSLSHEIVTSRLLSGSQSPVAGFHRLGKVASSR